MLIDNLSPGGAQNQLCSLAIGLSKRKYQVCVATYNEGDFFVNRLKQNNIKILKLKKRSKIGISVPLRLVRYIKINNIRCLISFLTTPNFYGAICKYLSGEKLKLIISYRSKTDFNLTSTFLLKVQEWSNSQANYIVSNSFHEKKTWLTKNQALETKWRVVYNSVDLDRFKPDKTIKRTKSFLVVGSIGPWKNGLTIISAFAHLKNKGYTPHIKWIAKRKNLLPHREKYLQEMNTLLIENDLTSQWSWQEPTSDINVEYSKCLSLILASKTEGLPNVVCEALACGTPCIVSDVLDHPKLITDKHNGLLFDPDNIESLASVIHEMEEMDSEKYEEMSQSAFLKGYQLFNKDKYIDQFINLIQK